MSTRPDAASIPSPPPSSPARSTRSRSRWATSWPAWPTRRSSASREDFGCVALRRARAASSASRAQSTPLQSGPIPGYIAGINRRFAELGDEWRPGDVVIHNHPYYGASHQPGRRLRRPGLLRRRARRLLGDDGAPPRPRRAHARVAAGSSTRPTPTPRASSSTRSRSRRTGRRNEFVWRILARQLPRAAARRRRHGGAGRRRQASAPAASSSWSTATGSRRSRTPSEDLMDYSERMLRARDRAASRTAPTRPRATSTASSTTPTRATSNLQREGRGDGRAARRSHVDLTGHGRRRSTCRSTCRFVGTVDIAIWLTLRSILLDASTHDPVPDELRPVPADHDRRARGLHREPALPGARRSRASAPATSSPTRSCARSRRCCRTASAPGVGNLKVVAYSGFSGGGSTGSTWTSRRASYGGRSARTASTPSTRSTRTPATTRSRTSSRTSRCA